MKRRRSSEETLEFLLAFDGRIHLYGSGHFLRFEIKRVMPSRVRPHGLRYSFTLHAPGGARLLGFDNAHRVAAVSGRFKRRSVVADHWHRTSDDPGRPYAFRDAETLLEDYFREVQRVLAEHGVSDEVVGVEEG
jgi:hypothetical protein